MTTLHIQQATAQPRIQIFQPLVGRDHRGQLRVVAMVEQLKELLLRPRAAALRAQVIQNQQRRGAQLLKEFIIAHIALRAKGRAQMVEQIGHDHEECRLTHGQHAPWQSPRPDAFCHSRRRR